MMEMNLMNADYFLLKSFMEYQKGYENDRNKGYCWMFLSGIHQGCSPWYVKNPPDPKISTQTGGGILGFLLLPTPFQKSHVSSQKQFTPVYRTYHHPDLMSKVSILGLLLHLSDTMCFFSSSAPQDPGISLICILRGLSMGGHSLPKHKADDHSENIPGEHKNSMA